MHTDERENRPRLVISRIEERYALLYSSPLSNTAIITSYGGGDEKNMKNNSISIEQAEGMELEQLCRTLRIWGQVKQDVLALAEGSIHHFHYSYVGNHIDGKLMELLLEKL